MYSVSSRTAFFKLGVLSIAILLNIILIVRLVWGAHSLISYRELILQHKSITQELQKYDDIIAGLSHEIQLLYSSPSYMEKMIRQHLSFVKDNEILYLVTIKKD